MYCSNCIHVRSSLAFRTLFLIACSIGFCVYSAGVTISEDDACKKCGEMFARALCGQRRIQDGQGRLFHFSSDVKYDSAVLYVVLEIVYI